MGTLQISYIVFIVIVMTIIISIIFIIIINHMMIIIKDPPKSYQTVYNFLYLCWPRECGAELASLLEQLDVEKPASPHQRDDLKEWTLRCSDILILVGMPRWLFR